MDPTDFLAEHRREMQAQADHDRLVASLPSRPSVLTVARNALAGLCLRAAAWLDAPAGYVQIPESH